MHCPLVKFLDNEMLHNPVYSNTRPHQFCVDCTRVVVLRKASSNQIFLADGTHSSSTFVSLQILIAFAPTQPTRFLQQALHGKCVNFNQNKREEQDSNSFSTSQQRLHVTCPHTVRLRLPSEHYSILPAASQAKPPPCSLCDLMCCLLART